VSEQPTRSSVAKISRDRHGRGLRSPLLPPSLPGARSRSEIFDDLVLDAVEHVERHWKDELDGLEFGVEDVPPPIEDGAATAEGGLDDVPLARIERGDRKQPSRIVIYRRPMELRCRNPLDLADLVHDVVVEQIAEYLGLDPDVVDGGDAG
jgi:predicted Zn-dependent protease with MMP-like domain